MTWSDSTREALKFEDLADFWKFAMENSPSKKKMSRKEMEPVWAGCSTWNEAKDLALRGWKEGLKEIEKYQAAIIPRITEKVLRPEQRYAVAGYNIDVGSFLASQPEYFFARDYNQRNYPGKIYTIVSSISFSQHILANTIMQRGAMICALVDAIEYAGHRTEVICNWVTTNKRKNKDRNRGAWLEVDVTIKKVNQPLDMSELSFCLGHPAMLRRMMFSLAERVGWADFAFSYGAPSEALYQGDIYIKEIFGEEVSNESAIVWVLAELKKLGIDIVEK